MKFNKNSRICKIIKALLTIINLQNVVYDVNDGF